MTTYSILKEKFFTSKKLIEKFQKWGKRAKNIYKNFKKCRKPKTIRDSFIPGQAMVKEKLMKYTCNMQTTPTRLYVEGKFSACITHCSVREWSNMPTPNINVVSINTSTQGQDKESTLNKREWPGYFWFLLTPYEPLEPRSRFGLFCIYYIIPHPFFTPPVPINCNNVIESL